MSSAQLFAARALAALACLCTAGCALLGGREAEGAPAVDLEFRGVAGLEEGDLRRLALEDLARSAAPDEPLERALVDDAAWLLEQHYLSSGFPFADVDYDFDDQVEPPRVRFRVDEGPRVRLAEVRLRGNEHVDGAALRASFGLVESGALTGAEPVWFSTAHMRAATSEIARHYDSLGFLAAQVGEPQIELSADRSEAVVTVEITEGVRYRLQRATFVGAEQTRAAATLAQIASNAEGQIYTPRLAFELRARAIEALGQRGHAEADVELEVAIDHASGASELDFEIVPGPVIVIGTIQVSGERKVDSDFVRSRLTLEPGKRWSIDDERESFRALYRTGLFRRIEIELVGQGSERDLLVSVEELPTLEFYIEPGWGSYELARVALGVRERNVFGSGRSLSADLTAAVRAQAAVVNLTDPWVLGSDYTMTYSVFANHREEPSFTSDQVGVATTLSRRFSSRWSGSFAYQFRFNGVSDVAADFEDEPEAEDSFDVSSLTLAAVRDSRDRLVMPRDGTHWRTSLEWASSLLGSQLDFLRARLSLAHMIPLKEGLVLGLGAETGVIAPLGGDELIPLQERFFNGGENTVRSFSEDGLGPKDADGEALGGEAATTLSVELRQRIKGDLEGALFADAGNVIEDYNDWGAFEDFRFGLGVGLRYVLPIGPLRVDAGWNPDPKDDEDSYAVHFAVGLSF